MRHFSSSSDFLYVIFLHIICCSDEYSVFPRKRIWFLLSPFQEAERRLKSSDGWALILALMFPTNISPSSLRMMMSSNASVGSCGCFLNSFTSVCYQQYPYLRVYVVFKTACMLILADDCPINYIPLCIGVHFLQVKLIVPARCSQARSSSVSSRCCRTSSSNIRLVLERMKVIQRMGGKYLTFTAYAMGLRCIFWNYLGCMYTGASRQGDRRDGQGVYESRSPLFCAFQAPLKQHTCTSECGYTCEFNLLNKPS